MVIKKLGWGHFSTVWMVKDRKAQTAGRGTHFYALKVQKSAEHYTEAAMDEVELLDCIATKRKHEISLLKNPDVKDEDGVTVAVMCDHAKYIATLHDSFFHTGPNGRHMCMVFSMLGCNLLGVIKAFNYRGIPIEVVKQMVKGVCKGLDFLHRRCKIIHTDLKPENVLLQFPNQFADDDEFGSELAALSLHDDDTKAPVALTIQELEASLQDPNLPPDERKKLKKRLKRKRQKERKRMANSSNNANEDDNDEDDENVSDDSEDADSPDEGASPFSAFSDLTMEKILSRASALMEPLNGDSGAASATEAQSRVKRRLYHSPFVLCNFGPHISELDSKLMEVMRESIEVSQPSVEELSSRFAENEKNGGLAEVVFLLRDFSSEEELANMLSSSLGGIPWENDSRTGVERNW